MERQRRLPGRSSHLALLGWIIFASTFCVVVRPAQATLIGDTVQGEIVFNGFTGNWFDPADHPGHQTGSSGIQPSAVVIDPDPAFTEFFYTDGTCQFCRVNISVDVDATTITIREFLINDSNPAGNLLGWDIWLTDLDWSGGPGLIQSAVVTSTDFTGFSISFTADALHISYAGGQQIDLSSPTDPRNELTALITLNGCEGVDCSMYDTECGLGACDENTGQCETVPAYAGDTCRAGSGDICDPDEVCDGMSIDCPSNEFAPPTTICRTGSGDICDPDEFCTGVAGAACPGDFLAPPSTPCGDDTANVCTDPDTCDGVGECLTNNMPCALVTDSSLCIFDVATKGICVGGGGNPTGEVCDVQTGNPACTVGTCVEENQFRLLFTPDGKIWPGYKLNASNPGQFFYNLFYADTPSTTVTLDINVPYPFVTQGAVPVHVFDGVLVQTGPVGGVEGCFLPPEQVLDSSITQIGIQDYIAGTMAAGQLTCDQVCGPDGSGACTLTVVDVPIPASGLAYVNVHLDYGLKGVHLDANPCDDGLIDRYDRGATISPWNSTDAFVDTSDQTGSLALEDCHDYVFSHTDDSSPLFTDTVQNLNIFKRIAGGFGVVTSSATGTGQAGAPVELIRVKTGNVVKSGVTDQDGYYTLEYKHKGKRALYSVVLTSHGLIQDIELRANGWAEVNFDVFTGTSSGAFNLDPKGKGSGDECSPTEDPELSCADGVDNDCDGSVDDADSDCGGATCTAGARGDSCSSNSDCCSNQCKGRKGNKTCR